MDCGLFRNKIKSLAQDMLDAKRFGQEQEFLEDLNTLKFYIRKLKEESEETREDSAFFEGELEEKETPKWSPAVQAYRERRQKRLDAKEEEGRWVTTEKDNKIHINEEGEVDKGNPFVVATANPAFRKAAKDAGDAVEFLTKLTEAQQKVVGKNYQKIYEALKPSAGEKSERAEPNGTENDMPVKIKKPEKPSTVHKHDGSVIGNHVLDYQNPHVTDEDRDRVKKDVHTHIDTGRRERGFSDRRAFFGAGKYIADEVKARFKLRRKAKDDDIFDKPQTEDVYDVLRDIRPFGPPESFDKVKVKSDIDQERTDAIVKEAMSRFPTDWYEGIDYGTVTIFIHDSPGRACYAVGYDGSAAIHVFARENPVTVKDLNLQDDHISDCGIVNTLAHELGHYIEQRNYEVGSIMRRCLQDRTAKSAEEYLEPGYETKPDSFFTRYMGKQYYDGTTEILSVLMQRLGYSDPFEQLTGKSSMSDAKDNESLRFLLGILGGL